MAKKTKAPPSRWRRLPLILCGGTVLALTLWLWQNQATVDEVRGRLYAYVDNQDILTLESKFSPEQIMERQRPLLVGQEQRTFQEPSYKYYPYLLLDVKYTEDHKSREGVLLWGLNDGEMVLNTETWETTHGFRDCLECDAKRQDFRLIQALARRHGQASIENLQSDLHLERELLDPWIESAKQKHLIVQKGNQLQLHFENPKLLVTPYTRIQQQLVSKPVNQAQKARRTYSRQQILTLAQAAFGEDFKVRSEQEVFLPVYSLSVLNPDGSLHTSEWNAITGQQLVFSYLPTYRQDTFTSK